MWYGCTRHACGAQVTASDIFVVYLLGLVLDFETGFLLQGFLEPACSLKKTRDFYIV